VKPVELLEQIPLPLLEWYRDHARDLPWRHTKDPYQILLSEVMLQQTRVAAVLDHYRRFLDAAPTIKVLAALEEDALLKLWQGLGYYRRARNLHRAAVAVTEEHGGVFPRTYEGLLALPGVGEYTAGAVASIAFGLPVSAVDGNVLRVVTRITADPADVTRAAVKRAISRRLEEVMPLHAPGTFNQALMELGATVCLPNGLPKCESCPLRALCRAYAKGDFTYPRKPPKKPRRVEERPVYLLFWQGQVALRRRPDRGLLAGLYEYPDTLTGAAHGTPEFVGAAVHVFTHLEWHMKAYAVCSEDGSLPPDCFWAGREDWRHTYSIPSAFAPFSSQVEERLT
jgi:A/G-specific adenine glycosylase